MIRSFDERRDIVIAGNPQETLTFCVEDFFRSYEQSVAKKNCFFVALSGGSTPKALFQLLTAPPYASLIDWSKVHLFWSDERCAPPTDPESNYHMAMTAGFAKVPIPPNQIHRMQTEGDLEKEALCYEKLIQETVKDGFDYLMLGMGEDGHTASLFPETKALSESKRLVVANYVPQKNTWRMTLTFPCIHQAKRIVFYVLGKSKQEKVLEVLHSKDKYPAGKIGTPEHKALWILDLEAGKDLLETKR